MEQDAVLVRQAHRWGRQAKAGKMPAELYEALAEGTSGTVKRQVISLAKVSRIVSDVGSIRPYNDFKSDWKYTKSVYGQRDTCALCGKHPIVENCILHDDVADREIMVGNVCVYRYVEIEVNGKVLDGDEKKEYLKTNMKEAKHQFNKKTFTQKYPSVLSDLERFQGMMAENQFFARNDPRKKLWRAIHRNMVKRLISHGFPSPKLSRQWDEFMLTAEQEYQEYSQRLSEYQEQRRKAAEEHKKRQTEMAQKMAELRNEWGKEADAFIRVCNELENDLNNWEKNMAVKTERKIRLLGQHRVYGGYKRFQQEVMTKYELKHNPESVEIPELASEINQWLTVEKDISSLRQLNTWERNFCESVRLRVIMGQELTPKQVAIIEKIRKNFA
jgi:RNase P protein component